MRALLLALLFGAAEARGAELAFVYVAPNVGTSSGGHAALVAGDVVYHLQNEDELVRVVRDGWHEFRLVYEELENRPLSVARLEVTPQVLEQIQRAFARLLVEQEIALARRDAARDDVAWLEAFAAHAPPPPLRGAGLLDPARAGDPDAVRLRARAAVAVAPGRPEPGEAGDLESLREALLAREADSALAGAYGLAPGAVAALPAKLDTPLSDAERAALESLSSQLERRVAALARSARPDRGYPMLLAQARYLAVRRSLARGRLALLDVFAGLPPALPDEFGEVARARRRAEAGELVRRGRALVLAPERGGEADLNLLEEAASAAAHDGRADLAGPLSEIGLRKLPALGRSLPAPPPAGDLGAALAAARARLAAEDARLAERWSYELVRRNCITELARAADGAFGSAEEVERALGAPVPDGGEPFGFIPYVFFARVRERLRVAELDELPSRRTRALAQLLAQSPGLLTRLRESIAYTSSVYEPRPRDSAFLLFTDDVFWRRPAYGLVNLAFGLGYAGVGLASAPFDRGTHLAAGLQGVLWSLPELAFVNVRKGSYDWSD
ncbi:MAG TPA: hypothetical protein VEI82_14220 [Myxococcota bacterium]|nr:hypothetical protein [Myxococcota bacterium]